MRCVKYCINIVVWSYCSKRFVFTPSQFPYVTLCPNVMIMKASKGKVLHNCKEIARGIMSLEYEKPLLLK